MFNDWLKKIHSCMYNNVKLQIKFSVPNILLKYSKFHSMHGIINFSHDWIIPYVSQIANTPETMKNRMLQSFDSVHAVQGNFDFSNIKPEIYKIFQTVDIKSLFYFVHSMAICVSIHFHLSCTTKFSFTHTNCSTCTNSCWILETESHEEVTESWLNRNCLESCTWFCKLFWWSKLFCYKTYHL
jgi:hypothetical protein